MIIILTETSLHALFIHTSITSHSLLPFSPAQYNGICVCCIGKEDTGITVSGEVHSPVVNYIARAQEAGGGHDHSHGHGHGHGHSHQHGGHDRGDGCDHHDHNHSHATAHCVHKATPASKATCFNGLSAVFRGKSESKNENHGFTFCCLV